MASNQISFVITNVWIASANLELGIPSSFDSFFRIFFFPASVPIDNANRQIKAPKDKSKQLISAYIKSFSLAITLILKFTPKSFQEEDSKA